MRIVNSLLLGFAAFVGKVAAEGDDVLVLVHGLTGWGEDELLGFPYWSYKDVLEDQGLQVFVAGIGKFTSNFDRACELFAQIKGTRVDYGACHSAEFGHERFGEDYTGLGFFPQWDDDNRINLMGHSMGGQTMRVLEHLLREGSGCPEDESELFTGGNNWIKSITAVSGTLDGTTFVDRLGAESFSDFVKDLVVGITVLADGSIVEDTYDANMHQWGLDQQPDETFAEFWKRVQASPVVKDGLKDFSMYDLSTVGARELNELGPLTYPDTYYFSIATERTNPKRSCFFMSCRNYELPDVLMTPLLWFSATVMGSSFEDIPNQANDGLVNRLSQICPTNSQTGKEACVQYEGVWSPGVWHFVDVPTLDHLQVIFRNPLTDIFRFERGPKKVYIDHGTRLKALPRAQAALVGVIADEHADKGDVLRSLEHLSQFSDQAKRDERARVGGIIFNTFLTLFIVAGVAVGARVYYVKKQKKKALELLDSQAEAENENRKSASANMLERQESSASQRLSQKPANLSGSLSTSLRVSKKSKTASDSNDDLGFDLESSVPAKDENNKDFVRSMKLSLDGGDKFTALNM